jgi:hypothetical protein
MTATSFIYIIKLKDGEPDKAPLYRIDAVSGPENAQEVVDSMGYEVFFFKEHKQALEIAKAIQEICHIEPPGQSVCIESNKLKAIVDNVYSLFIDQPVIPLYDQSQEVGPDRIPEFSQATHHLEADLPSPPMQHSEADRPAEWPPQATEAPAEWPPTQHSEADPDWSAELPQMDDEKLTCEGAQKLCNTQIVHKHISFNEQQRHINEELWKYNNETDDIMDEDIMDEDIMDEDIMDEDIMDEDTLFNYKYNEENNYINKTLVPPVENKWLSSWTSKYPKQIKTTLTNGTAYAYTVRPYKRYIIFIDGTFDRDLLNKGLTERTIYVMNGCNIKTTIVAQILDMVIMRVANYPENTDDLPGTIYIDFGDKMIRILDSSLWSNSTTDHSLIFGALTTEAAFKAKYLPRKFTMFDKKEDNVSISISHTPIHTWQAVHTYFEVAALKNQNTDFIESIAQNNHVERDAGDESSRKAYYLHWFDKVVRPQIAEGIPLHHTELDTEVKRGQAIKKLITWLELNDAYKDTRDNPTMLKNCSKRQVKPDYLPPHDLLNKEDLVDNYCTMYRFYESRFPLFNMEVSIKKSRMSNNDSTRSLYLDKAQYYGPSMAYNQLSFDIIMCKNNEWRYIKLIDNISPEMLKEQKISDRVESLGASIHFIDMNWILEQQSKPETLSFVPHK